MTNDQTQPNEAERKEAEELLGYVAFENLHNYPLPWPKLNLTIATKLVAKALHHSAEMARRELAEGVMLTVLDANKEAKRCYPDENNGITLVIHSIRVYLQSVGAVEADEPKAGV